MIHLDNAASTPCDPRTIAAMAPFFAERFGNPSSLHAAGRDARHALEEAREKIAKLLGAAPEEVIFTASATESDVVAVRGIAQERRAREGKTHLISSALEHHALLEVAEQLAEEGFELTILPVDERGRIRPRDLKKTLRPETALVSIVAANSEIGVIQDLKELGAICQKAGVPFHSDTAQLAGKEEILFNELPVDALSISAQKFRGPKGISCLLLKKGTPLRPLFPGSHEGGRRASTENVAGAVGMATALELAMKEFLPRAKEIAALRDSLAKKIEKEIPGATRNGDSRHCLPTHLNFSFDDVEGEALQLRLDARGFAVSTGSACASGKTGGSRTLRALEEAHDCGLKPQLANRAIRVSLGIETTAEELGKFFLALKEEVAALRELSAGAT
jgi:cysteine desulfurase